MLIPLVEGLLHVCHRLFQGFGPPGEVKLPLMSFWVELLPAPVHHFRAAEGSDQAVAAGMAYPKGCHRLGEVPETMTPA